MDIYIGGVSTTRFGELWEKSLRGLIKEASFDCLVDAQVEKKQIEAVYVGNMLSGMLSGQQQLGPLATEEIGLDVFSCRVEGACASGGLAIHEAVNALLAGKFKTVMVIGVEKMTDRNQDFVSMGLMAAGSDAERQAGATFSALYALMAKAHMEKYQTTSQMLAAVAVKNHFHGFLNSKAQFPFTITIEQVLKSALISDPLRLLDCSPLTDGAAAVILTTDSKLVTRQNKVMIKSCEVATDTLGLAQRKSLTELVATQKAAQKAFYQAGISPSDVDVAELHDCFTIAEILALEDLGFYKKGEAAPRVLKGETRLGSKGLVTNTSGGLKSCGHPVGATGVKQLVEIVMQLRQDAGKKQVEKAKVGLCQNVGGSGATAVVTILTK